MLELFEKKKIVLAADKKPMHSLLSIKTGIHGTELKRTAVPRKGLVSELDKETQLQSTKGFPVGEVSKSIRFYVNA